MGVQRPATTLFPGSDHIPAIELKQFRAGFVGVPEHYLHHAALDESDISFGFALGQALGLQFALGQVLRHQLEHRLGKTGNQTIQA